MTLSNRELSPSLQIKTPVDQLYDQLYQTLSLRPRARGNKPLACPYSGDDHFAPLKELFQSNDIS